MKRDERPRLYWFGIALLAAVEVAFIWLALYETLPQLPCRLAP